jgi:hypothetical protein
MNVMDCHDKKLVTLQGSSAEDVCWVLDQMQQWVFLSAPRWLTESAANLFSATFIPNGNGSQPDMQHVLFRCV